MSEPVMPRSAQEACAALEQTLLEHLPLWVAQVADLDDVTDWHQLPDLAALSSATFPAGAIACPGLAAPPTRRNRSTYDAVWRVIVAVYDRGEDFDDTSLRVRNWAALVRAVVIQHPTLGGLAETTAWVGEDYAERPTRGTAATLGGCAVSFDVTLRDVVPQAPPRTPDQGPAQVFRTANTSVTIRPHQE